MSQIVQVKSPVLAAVTDSMNYIKARKEVEKLVQKHNLRVADMPMTIQAMSNNSKIREAIRPRWIDTITGEYHGQRDGDRSYEAWHSIGSLATVKGLEQAFSNAEDYAFMKIDDNEWVAVGNGNYNGQDVARVHLIDMKKGSVPTTGTPYTVFVRLDKDSPNINDNDRLDYDTFMQDDRVLMIAGSPDNREALAKMLFGAKKDGGEGWDSVGSYHRINEVGFDTTARGRLVYLYYDVDGLGGDSGIYYSGRFFGVSDRVAQLSAEGAAHERSTTQGIVYPTLEQTLAIVNNPILNRVGMVRAISQLYK